MATEVVPTDLFAFGNSRGPRPPRVGIDIDPDASGMIGPESPPLPAGASTFSDPDQAGLRGVYYRLPAGTTLPVGLGAVADGRDVDVKSRHPPTHYTIYPMMPMLLTEFIGLFLRLPWQRAGKM